MQVSTFHDNETLRQQKNLTRAQRKANLDTKEGVLVNSFIKENQPPYNLSLNDTMDTLIISKNTRMPEKLYEKDNSKEKSLLPISSIALGVMGAIAGVTGFIRYSSRLFICT